MAIISISEAAKLTGKNRRTLQRHIASGKLTKTISATGEEGVETSELIRVYGELNYSPMSHNDAPHTSAAMSRNTTPITPLDVADKKEGYAPDKFIIENLKTEIKSLHALLDAKEANLKAQQEHIDSLKHAMKLLEFKKDSTEENSKKKPWWKLFS